MNIGERIKNRRLELGLSVDEVAEKIGKNRATVYRYESREIEDLPTSVLEPLAKALRTTPAFLMGWDREPDEIDKKVLEIYPDFVPGKNYISDLTANNDNSNQNPQQFPYEKLLQEINNPDNSWGHRVPLYASVQKENDKIVPYNFIKWIFTDDERAKNYIALLIPGEEFEPKFTDKDIALINQQNTLENNKYFYILINGNLPTIRKVSFKENDTIILQADNPQIGIELASANDIVVGKLISIQKTENYE